MRLAVFILVALSLISVGCSTTSIGRPPSDLDLKNDGSPEAQRALEKKYRLAYRGGLLERQGATPADVAKETGLDNVEAAAAYAWSDEAAEHFESSELASVATETPLVSFDRFANSSTPPLALQAGGVLIGAAVATTLAIVNGPAIADPVQQISFIADSGFSGAFIGLVVSLPLVIIYDWTVPPLSGSLASSDYRRGVRAYNVDLARRIAAAAPPEAAPALVPPPPPPPPTSDEPPPPVGDPGDLPPSG